MHNLAIALDKKGFNITSGSDDFIRNPSKDRLAKHNLLPKNGWFKENITNDINLIILGMHAKEDNPELIKQKIGLKIYSYPEYLYEQSKDKKRIVSWRKPWKNYNNCNDITCIKKIKYKL